MPKIIGDSLNERLQNISELIYNDIIENRKNGKIFLNLMTEREQMEFKTALQEIVKKGTK